MNFKEQLKKKEQDFINLKNSHSEEIKFYPDDPKERRAIHKFYGDQIEMVLNQILHLRSLVGSMGIEVI